MLGWWFHMATAIPVRVWFARRHSSASLPMWHPTQPLDWNSCSPESEGGNEKLRGQVAGLRQVLQVHQHVRQFLRA